MCIYREGKQCTIVTIPEFMSHSPISEGGLARKGLGEGEEDPLLHSLRLPVGFRWVTPGQVELAEGMWRKELLMFEEWYSLSLYRTMSRLRLSTREVYALGPMDFLQWKEDHVQWGLRCPKIPPDIAGRFAREYRQGTLP